MASWARRLGRNPYEQGWKSASKIGSSTSLSAACTTRSATVGIPSRRLLPPGLGISRSRTGRGRNLWAFSSARRSARKPSSPRTALTYRAVRPSTPAVRALVPLDPTPPNQQERRITDEVEQIIEPATGIVGCPMVQLGLDSQYPRLRLLGRRPRRVGVHQRPPGLPAPALRTRCRPSPCPDPAGTCGRLSRPRTTTAAPPHPGAHSRQRTCPPPAWPAGGEGNTWAVPTFVL
jgi:hypothetical protein